MGIFSGKIGDVQFRSGGVIGVIGDRVVPDEEVVDARERMEHFLDVGEMVDGDVW